METNQSSTLLGRVREVIRYKHYSIRTERTYVEWVRRFVAFHGRRHPREMGAEDVRAFLGYLASELKVAASTHQQALSALLFLYRDVLGVDLPWLTDLDRPKKPKRTPLSAWRESPSRRRRIRCVTPSPRICWNPATTFAPFRNCWGIRMCRRR